MNSRESTIASAHADNLETSECDTNETDVTKLYGRKKNELKPSISITRIVTAVLIMAIIAGTLMLILPTRTEVAEFERETEVLLGEAETHKQNVLEAVQEDIDAARQ